MSKKTILGYKVRHSKTNLYLSSVSKNKWTTVGKTWPRKGDVVRAINSGLKSGAYRHRRSGLVTDDILDDIVNWDIIELKETNKYSALFLLDRLKTGG